ncbi:LysE family translocator [Streptoalloteichus hindustanus]|uniref:Threonine/homoserine/homoserine lactone efflux protein n=1 Tax=Streptoalloteichus hindustanus TaxID=2017 RepID=A0A1M5CW08_STRHI|nr:LysE family translocator [Streptoalloteichus hindustanus]SHF58918.1 Threonine/homoserine/homoserine lactone efflux protein [Streptoalloteichus hindustanus]
MSLEFLVTTLIVVVTPGPGVLYTMAAGLARGTRASAVAAVGCTLGIVPHMAAAITGLAALLHTSALAFQILKYLGVAYLVYMAWGALRDKETLAVEAGDTAPRPALRVIVSGILLNILNPKLTIFFFAFLPQFVNTAESNAFPRMLELSGVFMLAMFLVFVVYGWFAARIRSYVVNRPRVLSVVQRVFGVAFLGLAARLAFEG